MSNDKVGCDCNEDGSWDHIGNRARDVPRHGSFDHFGHTRKNSVTWNGGCQLHGGAHECHKMDERLHVVTAIFNPGRYEAIYKNYRAFERHMAESGAILHTVEMAIGDRPWAISSPCDQRDLQVRGRSQIWLKENLLNLAVQSLPHDWKYVAWIDADVTFMNDNWVEETVQALQIYDVIQPWSECYSVGPKGQHQSLHRSFMRQYTLGEDVPHFRGGYGDFWHPGYAWAATRRAWNSVGGLLDVGILGAGDHHMALALIGEAHKSMPGNISREYRREVMAWQERAEATIRRNVGYVEGAIKHAWHGRTVDRKYRERWDILTRNRFDPDHHVIRNSYGVYELSATMPIRLRDDIRNYFLQRNDDANTIA